MREVRVENLERFEAADGEVRILANSGELEIVFPREVWEGTIEAASSPSGPTPEELESLKRRLKEHAGENSFATAIEDVPLGGPLGDSESRYGLVLRPAGMFAMTTGYLFLPVVRAEHVALFGARVDEDDFVEGAYLIGAVAEDTALAAGDEGLKVLSIRGRRCSASRFELTPELWQVLAEDMGWKNVKPDYEREG